MVEAQDSQTHESRGQPLLSIGYARSVVLRCTKRILDLLGVDPARLTQPQPADDDWYLHLLWIDRQKCLLLTHSGTLFSAFRASVRKPDLRPIGPYVTSAIEAELSSEGVPPDTFGDLDPDSIQLAKTASRSTLGFMNEMAHHLRYQAAHAGGINRCDIYALNRDLRRTLHNRGGYSYPIDLVAERLAARGTISDSSPDRTV
jgi:hypothetical protein